MASACERKLEHPGESRVVMIKYNVHLDSTQDQDLTCGSRAVWQPGLIVELLCCSRYKIKMPGTLKI